MTRASIYEKREGKKDIQRNGYFFSDYVRLNLLKNIVTVSIAYLLILGLYGLMRVEELFQMVANLQIFMVFKEILLVYVIILVIHSGIGLILYAWQYQSSHDRIKKYYRMLKLIDKYGEEEEE